MPEGGLRNPALREEHVLRPARVLQEVVDTRHSVVEGPGKDALLLFKVHLLPVAPFHAPDVLAYVDNQPLAIGFLLLSQQETGRCSTSQRVRPDRSTRAHTQSTRSLSF